LSKLRALLLAAGLGTRLRPLTDSVPKCLVEINGRPLLDYWIELLSDAGIADILVNLHYLPNAVKSYIGKCSYPVNITMAYEERLLGTGGTLLKNSDFFQNGPAMLIHADNLSTFDVQSFIHRYEMRRPGIEITMMTFDTLSPEACGIVQLDDEGVVKAFHEKVRNPPSTLANGAVYVLSPAVLEFLRGLGKKVIDFSTEVLPHFLGRINTYHNGIYHRDIGTVESLLAAQKDYAALVGDGGSKSKV
jgi:mannose-1-phosphate guanylyltransferase